MTRTVARGGLLAGLAAVALGGALLHAPADETTRGLWVGTSHADAGPTAAPFSAERVEVMGAVMSALAGVTGSTTVSTGRPVGFVTLTDTHEDEPSPESRQQVVDAVRRYRETTGEILGVDGTLVSMAFSFLVGSLTHGLLDPDAIDVQAQEAFVQGVWARLGEG